MERVLVIGATSGIGRALAGRLAASGCRVGIVGRRAEPLTERDSDPSENPFFQAAADVTDPAAAVAVLERLVQRMGGMDLCLVAAGAGELNPELDYALELPAIRTNVVGWTAVVDWGLWLLRAAGPGASGGDHLGRRPARQLCGSGLQRLEGLSDQLYRGACGSVPSARTGRLS
mgnify:CR=1 FL=1